ncbi:MAG: prolyl oligopeptidase family serine peptidase [Candidatus Neomarinimicrobiota bacterium]|nr:prolyl oligopeptidase family serine peptidase [Candidatus Neomarinimicrobiota bacterium]
MKSISLKIIFILSFYLISCDQSIDYPATKKIGHYDTYHGIEISDPYRWLEDDMSDETGQWVKSQNKVTSKYLRKIGFRKKLERRIKKLNDYEKVGAPFKEGNYEYYYKNSGLQNHSVIYRSRIGSSQDPEVFIDPNTFSKDGTVALRGLSFTKDGSLLAYMITEGGSDWRKIIVMDTETKEIIGDTLKDVKFSGLSWKNNDGFFYSSYDNPNEENKSELSAKTQYHKLYYHKLNTSQSKDQLIYGGSREPNRYISGSVSEDQRYLAIYAGQNTSGRQLYIQDLKISDSKPIKIQGDYFARASVLYNKKRTFYLFTNIDAPNGRIVSVDLSKPNIWKDVVPESENVMIASSGGGYLFVRYLVDAKSQIMQYDLKGKIVREIDLPAIGSAYGFNAKEDEKDLYYSFSSYTYPSTIYKYNIESGESILYRQPAIDFEPSDYTTEQVFYKSKDQTTVPMFITYKKDVVKNGNSPTILYGYGGFNISQTPRFSATNIAWLENGGVYAVANIRGGGEYGKKWHKAGTQMKKQNVFDDFIAAAEYLISENYTSSEYLAIRGGSNGGLLVGAVMIQRPELFKVAIPAVGVLDMLRYHEFTAGAGWSDDYGTADDSPEMFKYLLKYSPVHALKPETKYPATLVTTADHDDRVVPAHSFKFAARLQEFHIGESPVLIRIQTRGGHGSVSMDQRMELYADVFSFIWYNMGTKPKI